MRRSLVLVAAAAFLGGCSTATPTVTPAVTHTKIVTVTPTPPPAETTTVTVTPSELPLPTPTGQILGFGQEKRYEDGFIVGVSEPVRFTPSKDAQGAGDNNVYFTVTYENSSSKPFDPSHVTLRVISQEKDAGEVFDPGNGLNGQWDTSSIPAGKTRTQFVGFNVIDPINVSVTVIPDLDHRPPATFSD